MNKGGGFRSGMLSALLNAQIGLIAQTSINEAHELALTIGKSEDLLSLTYKNSDRYAREAFKPLLDYPIRQRSIKIKAHYAAMKNRKFR
jgi:hypothetical protein